MVILVASCDNHKDTFYPFHHCMEKYWPEHPRVVYSTETIINPYYTTIHINYPLDIWSARIRETLERIKDREVLLVVDDVFIRRPVDVKRVQDDLLLLKDNVACVNFERVYDTQNDPYADGFMIRRKGAKWEVSIQCGLWDREKLMDVLSEDCNPWEVEERQHSKGYDYLINAGDYIIDYGYRNMRYFGLHSERWCREIIPFFQQEGIEVDMSRGVI